MWLSVFLHLYVRSCYVSVASDDLLIVRVPYDELLVWNLHRVEIIDIHRQTASASRVSECLFTESSDLPHDVGRVVVAYNVDLVASLVCVPQLL